MLEYFFRMESNLWSFCFAQILHCQRIRVLLSLWRWPICHSPSKRSIEDGPTGHPSPSKSSRSEYRVCAIGFTFNGLHENHRTSYVRAHVIEFNANQRMPYTCSKVNCKNESSTATKANQKCEMIFPRDWFPLEQFICIVDSCKHWRVKNKQQSLSMSRLESWLDSADMSKIIFFFCWTFFALKKDTYISSRW